MMRRTPLRRYTGLRASTARSRRRAALAQGGMSAPLALVLAAECTVAQAARICGCDPDALELAARTAWRTAVMTRDGWRCQNCLRRATDCQHRIRRGIGGTANPAIAFGLANGVALCRPCHDLADRMRDEGMHQRGFRLDTDQDPELVPIVTPTPSGLVRVWLGADGSRSYVAPEGVAA